MKQIYIRICTILILCFPFFSLVALPHENGLHAQSTFIPCKKTYISPDQIFINHHEILVKVNDEWFLTESLHRDWEGIYVQTLSPEVDRCAGAKVPCRNCQRCVYEGYDICPYCGKPI